MAKKKKSATGGGDSVSASSTQHQQPLGGGASLIICRNKHWRYISSFHGPWLQLPPEILDSLAHQNYTMPPPRLIDPSVFYDVVKIRKHVDEAAQDSVRATTGISNVAMSGRMDYFGAGGGPGSQLSKERIFKIRQKAVRLLSKAFELDEVAASVATMQATSTVEDVGAHVLKREPGNTGQDAKYVNFFHEKIPSRAMELHTPLEPLTEITAALPIDQQPAPLRTRALVQIFKQQWDGAAMDLTLALRIVEELKRTHKPNQQELELASRMRKEQEEWARGFKDWRSVPLLKEEDQPKSLEMQLLFNRAGVYLTIACNSVHAALDKLKNYQARSESGEDMNGVDIRAHAARLDARKRVKVSAKKALKDYMTFLSNFDYTPGLPYEVTNEIMRRVYDLANGNRTQTPLPQNPRLIELDEGDTNGNERIPLHATNISSLAKYEKPRHRPDPFERDENGWPKFPTPNIHPASTLFSERPPSDLPPFPNDSTTKTEALRNETLKEAFGSREAVTYHPLLTDALHSLLLAHALLQTSPAEMKRHAHNAARLTRIADGYPIFQAARSPARADWIEVLRRANNWLGLCAPWQTLCKSAPLPDIAGGWAKAGSGAGNDSTSVVGRENKLEVMRRRKEMGTETAEQKRERIKQESIIDALSDDRVVDEESFQKAVRARERRALEDEEGISGPLKDKDPGMTDAPISNCTTDSTGKNQLHPFETNSKSSKTSSPASSSTEESFTSPKDPQTQKQQAELPKLKRWAQDEYGKEYPISTERAEAIARWIKEAPLSMAGAGGRKKKKKSAVPSSNATADPRGENFGAGEAVDGFKRLNIAGEGLD